MIITVDNINKSYKNGSLELQVLKNISFKVDKGEFWAVLIINMKEDIFLME